MAKVTAYLPGDEIALPTAPAVPPGQDNYSGNVQVAKLNALNAALAVIRWKRYLGFYATHTASNQTVYKLYLDGLRNGDAESAGLSTPMRARRVRFQRRWNRAFFSVSLAYSTSGHICPCGCGRGGGHQTVASPLQDHFRR